MNTSHYVEDPVFRRSDFRCVYCGADLLADFDAFMGMTRDHLVPRSAGGPNAAENRVASCVACDRAKGHVVPVDLAEAVTFVQAQRRWLEELFEAVRRDVRGPAGRADRIPLEPSTCVSSTWSRPGFRGGIGREFSV